jgi:hypothetical protein
VLLLGELVKDLEGAVAIVDHLQVLRQLMGIQDPADELHINRVRSSTMRIVSSGWGAGRSIPEVPL